MSRSIWRASLLVAALAAAACGSGDDAVDQTTPTTAAPSSSSATETSADAPAAGSSVDPQAWVLEAIGSTAETADQVSIADLSGRPTLVTFFAGDGAADDDLAAKVLVAAEFADQVQFVGVALGDRAEALATAERSGITGWILAADLDRNGLLAAMGGTSTPSTAFYDAEGTYLGLQPSPLNETTLRAGLFQLFGLGEAPPAPPSDYAGFRSQATACGAGQPAEVVSASFEAAEAQGLSGSLTAVISTSCGDIELALDADTYPETVNSFVFLARQGYFDGVVCHRLVSGFVLQCGDQTATGTAGPGYSVPDEFPPEGFVYERGVVAMANAGPGSTGSQFFIVTGDGSFLANTFSILGTVIGSEEALTALETVPLGLSARGEQSVPLETIYINGVTLSE